MSFSKIVKFLAVLLPAGYAGYFIIPEINLSRLTDGVSYLFNSSTNKKNRKKELEEKENKKSSPILQQYPPIVIRIDSSNNGSSLKILIVLLLLFSTFSTYSYYKGGIVGTVMYHTITKFFSLISFLFSRLMKKEGKNSFDEDISNSLSKSNKEIEKQIKQDNLRRFLDANPSLDSNKLTTNLEKKGDTE